MNHFKKTCYSILIITNFLTSGLCIADEDKKEDKPVSAHNNVDLSASKPATEVKATTAEVAIPATAEKKAKATVDPSTTVLDLTKLDVGTKPSLSSPTPKKNYMMVVPDPEGGAAQLQPTSVGGESKPGTQVTGQKIDSPLKNKLENVSSLATTQFDDGCRGKKFEKIQIKDGLALRDLASKDIYPVTLDTSSKWDPKQLKNSTDSGQEVDAARVGTQFDKYGVYRIRPTTDTNEKIKDEVTLNTKTATYYSTNGNNVNNENAKLKALGVDDKGCFDLGGGGGAKGMDGTI